MSEKLISRSMITNVPLDAKHYSCEQYDISIFCKGFITEAGNIIGGAVVTRPVIIKQTTGSIARVIMPGTGSTTLNINVNSTTFEQCFLLVELHLAYNNSKQNRVK